MLRTAYRGFASTITLVAALLTLSASSVAASDNKKPLSLSVSSHASAAKAKAVDAMGHVPLAFEANQGQADSRVQYFSRGAGYTLFLTRDEAVLSLTNGKGQPDVLRIKLTGADAKSKVTALERLGWNTNYFIGKDPKKWRTNVPNYRKVQFDSVYPGVALVYYGNQRQLEHDFVVAPNADPKQIAMEIAGAKDLSIGPNGDLVINTPRGDVRFEKPVIYQDVNGARKDVGGKFILRGKKNVGFEIADYDKSKALIIDPVINFGSLISSNAITNANSVVVDGSGGIYVAGITQATSFPAPTTGAATAFGPGGSDDIYVVKVSADGSTLGYTTFIGSTGQDSEPIDPIANIALDNSNNAYLTGKAFCTVANTSTDFPTTTDAFQQSSNCPGLSAAFLTVIGPAGNTLVYSTLYGGDADTTGGAFGYQGVSVLNTGNGPQVFVAGLTTSTGAPALPTSVNAFQATPAAGTTENGFLAQFNPTSLAIPIAPALPATCDGAGNDTIDFGVAHNFSVNEQIIVSGITPTAGNLGTTTFNTPANQHSTITAIGATTITYTDSSCLIGNGGDPGDTGSGGTATGGLVYGTYFGSPTAATSSSAVVVVATALNNVYIAGSSNASDLPLGTVATPAQAYAGGFDGFVAQFDPTQAVGANTLVNTSYFGGTADDGVGAMLVDGAGNVYLTGRTLSTDIVAGGVQTANGGGTDAFITQLTGDLTTVNATTYLGGTGDDIPLNIALDPSGNFVWVVGQTTSSAFFNVNSPTSYSGNQDGFIAKLSTALDLVSVSSYFGGNGSNERVSGLAPVANDQIIVVGNTDSTDLYTSNQLTGGAYQTTPASANPAGFIAKFAANSTTITPTWFIPTAPTNGTDPLRADGSNSSDYTITLTNNDVGDAHNVTLDLHSDLTKLLVNTITPTPNTIQCVTGQAKTSSGVTCDVGTVASGNSVSVVANVSAIPCAGAPTCPATTAVTNIAVGAAEAGSTDTSQSITSNILPLADIQVSAITAQADVTVAANKFVVQTDSSFTYKYTLTNIGPNDSGTFDVTNNLPAGFTATTRTIVVTTGTATSQTCDAQVGSTVTCHVNGLAKNGVLTVTMAGDPTSLLASNVASTTNQLDFSASVAVTGATYVDPNPANDTGSNTGSTLERDVTLTVFSMTATPDVNSVPGKFIVDSDSTITYALTVKNTGASDSTNTEVTVQFPAGSVLTGGQPAACTVSGTFSGGALETCDIGTLAKGASLAINFVITPPALSANSASAALNSTAAITTNPVSANNIGGSGNSANLTQERDINLIPTMTAKPDVNAVANGPFVVQQDTTILYAVTVQNSGPSNATNVRLIINFPINSTFVQPAACNGSSTYNPGNGTETCVIGNLTTAAGVVPINFVVTPPALAGNTATTVLSADASMTTSPVSAFNSGLSNPTVSNTQERVAPLTFTVTPTAAGSDTAEQQVGSVSYQVKAHNAGPSDAVNVQFQITLDRGAAPNFTSLLGTDGAAGCGAPVGQVVTCQSAATIPANSDYIVTFTATAPTTINGNAAPATQTFSTGSPVTATVQAVGANNPTNALVSVGGATQNPGTTPFSAIVERRSDLSVGAVTATAGPVPLTGAATVSLDVTAGSANTNYAIPGVTVAYTLKPTAPATQFTTFPVVSGTTTGGACVVAGVAPAASVTINCTVASLANAGQLIHLVTSTPVTDNINAGTVATAAFTTSACISGPVTAASDPGNGCGAGSNNLSTTAGADPSTQIQRQADLDATTVAFAQNGATANPRTLAALTKYNFVVKNNGPDTAVNVKVKFTVTPTTVNQLISNISALTAGASCVADANTFDVDCTINSIAAGASFDPGLQVTLPILNSLTGLTAIASDNVSLNAALDVQTSTFDTTAGNNANATTVTSVEQRTSDVNIAAQPFNATSSAASNAGAVTATTITTNLTGAMQMTFGLTNAGPDTALNSKVQLTNVSGAVATPISGISSTAGSTCTLVGGNIQCSVNSVPTGPATTITVTFTPLTPTSMTLAGAASPTGSFTTTAALTAQTSYVDGTAGNDTNATTVTTNLQRQSNIQMNFGGAAFTVTPSPVDLTGQLTYTYNYKNAGPDPALKLATHISLTAGPITTPSSFITAGSTFDIGAGPVALANAATNGCQVTSNTTYDCEVDGPIPVGVGNGFVLLFTPPLTTNMFNGAATDAIFNNLSASSAAVVDNNLGDNASPTQVTTSIQRTADLAVTSAAATSFTAGNTNISGSFVVQRDSTIHFDYNVKNNGPSDSPATVITVSFPAGSLLPAQPAACTGASNYNAGTATETCDIGLLTNGTTLLLSFNVTPPALNAASAFTGLNAQASITGGVIDSTPANNAMTALITQERDVALTIPTMTATPNVNNAPPGHPFVDGQDSTISYVLNLSNAGPSDATNVVLTFNLPAGSLLPVQPGACGGGSNYNAGTASETCNIGTIANGATPSVTFVVTPPALPANTATTVLSALASLSTSSAVATGNSSNAVNLTQERDADLSVTISAPVTTLDVGPGFDAVSNGHQQVVYTILANNAGPSPATGVKVTDVLPTGFNFTSFTSTLGGVNCTGAGVPVVVTCDFAAATLASAATNTITITATATQTSLNNALATNIVTNNASIASADLNDPTPGNNSTPVAASVTLHGEADISITSVTATPVIGAPLHVGDDLNYAITIHNAGPHPTQLNLAFSNVLPAGVTPVSVTAGSGSTNCVLGATTTCTLAAGIASGNNEIETIRVHVPPTAVGALNDSADIHTPANPVVDGEDSNLGNNTGANATTAIAAADVVVAEAAVPTPTFATNPTVFTVTLTNPAPPAYTPGTPNPAVGGSASTGVTVHNVVTINPSTSIPTGVTSISNNFGAACPATAAFAGGTATFDCTGGTIASNATNTITFTLTPAALGTMSATASITASAVFDPNAANNTATTNDATVNTSVCAVGACAPITPIPDPVTGNNPLTLPGQSATITFNNVTTQGATTLAASNQPAACLVNDPTGLPAGSTLAGTYNHQPFHGNVAYTGSRTYACGAGTQPLFYDLATTAITAGGANVCINYNGTNFHKPERVRLVILLGSGGAADITTAAGFSATNICGHLPALTAATGTVRLAVMEPSNAMPNLVPATAVNTSTSSGNSVALNVNASTDIDTGDACIGSAPACVGGIGSDSLSYTWTSGGFLVPGTYPGASVSQPIGAIGTVNFTLVATDPYGVSETRILSQTFTAGGGGGGGGGGGITFITTANVNRGQAASFTTELDNSGGAPSGTLGIANASTLANSQIVCSVSPTTLPAGAIAQPVTVLCSTQGQVFGKLTAPRVGPEKGDMPLLAGMVGITALPLLGMMLVPGKSRRRRMLKMWAAIGLVMMFTMFQAACGGGGSSSFGGAPALKNAGTPAGNYQVVLGVAGAGGTVNALPSAGVSGATAAETNGAAGSTTFTLTVQ